MKKLVIGAVVILAVVVVVGVVVSTRDDVVASNEVLDTNCPTGTANQLAAQTVPTASLVPCITLLGGPWNVTAEEFTDEGTKVSMVGEDAPEIQWKLELTSTCDTSSLTDRGTAEGASMFEHTEQDGPTFSRRQAFVFDGGCVTSTLDMPVRFDRALVLDDVDDTLLLIDRSALNAEVREQTDGDLRLDP